MRKVVSFIAVLASLGSAWAGEALPIHRTAHQVREACRLAEQRTPESVRRLLSVYPRGGEGLTFAVYSAVVDSPTAAHSMVAVANAANPEQMIAIALGLIQALRKLDDFGPDCQQTCWRNRDAVIDREIRDSEARERAGVRERIRPDEPLPLDVDDECLGPVRAAFRCAAPPVDAVTAALAAQAYARDMTNRASVCNAPIYAGGHNFLGPNVVNAPRVSRN